MRPEQNDLFDRKDAVKGREALNQNGTAC